MADQRELIADIFGQVDNTGFVDYEETEQPWKDMNITFLCDIHGANSLGYDPYDSELKDLVQPQKIKLLCQPKCWDMGTGGMGGH